MILVSLGRCSNHYGVRSTGVALPQYLPIPTPSFINTDTASIVTHQSALTNTEAVHDVEKYRQQPFEQRQINQLLLSTEVSVLRT
jgi:hypothetical protein